MFLGRWRANANEDAFQQEVAQQQTQPYPSIFSTSHAMLTRVEPEQAQGQTEAVAEQPKKRSSRVLAPLVVGVSGLILYFIWNPVTAVPQATHMQPTVVPKTLTSRATAGSDTTGGAGGEIQVYINGAVQHPGVYTLSSNARVYQLLQAAGGALTTANLAAINMAAHLSDGQEIYLARLGETPLAVLGGAATGGTDQAALVNINSASAEQLKQSLHLSNKAAQDIVNYRLQHGAFSSVNALAQVVSKSVYDRIKDKVTV